VQGKFPILLLSTLLRDICMETRRETSKKEIKNIDILGIVLVMQYEEDNTFPKPYIRMTLDYDRILRI